MKIKFKHLSPAQIVILTNTAIYFLSGLLTAFFVGIVLSLLNAEPWKPFHFIMFFILTPLSFPPVLLGTAAIFGKFTEYKHLIIFSINYLTKEIIRINEWIKFYFKRIVK